MTVKVIRSDDYLTDLLGAWQFHAEWSVESADRLVAEIESRVALLESFPDTGERFPQFGPDCRRTLAGGYVIYYQRLSDHVRILRVLHGAMDIEGLA